MAIPGQIYEFPDSAPSFNEVHRVVAEIEETVTMEIVEPVEKPERPMTPEERAYLDDQLAKLRAKHPPKSTSRSFPLAPRHLILSKARDQLTVDVSTDGRILFVFGEYCGPKLFKSVCAAIEKLGGRVRESRRK